jgi:hypothetical protein
MLNAKFFSDIANIGFFSFKLKTGSTGDDPELFYPA